MQEVRSVHTLKKKKRGGGGGLWCMQHLSLVHLVVVVCFCCSLHLISLRTPQEIRASEEINDFLLHPRLFCFAFIVGGIGEGKVRIWRLSPYPPMFSVYTIVLLKNNMSKFIKQRVAPLFHYERNEETSKLLFPCR